MTTLGIWLISVFSCGVDPVFEFCLLKSTGCEPDGPPLTLKHARPAQSAPLEGRNLFCLFLCPPPGPAVPGEDPTLWKYWAN